MKYDVFLSRKSEDAHLAKELYDFLTEKGLVVFDSQYSLPELGNADYQKAIDQALDFCTHIIVVGSSIENITSSWVEAEWRLFISEKRSGNKNGNILSVITNNIAIKDLPASLRYYEVIYFDKINFDRIYVYLSDLQKSNNTDSIETVELKIKYFNEGENLLKLKNYSEAYFKFLQSSELEHPPAFWKIGLLYYNGLGVKKDYNTSKIWFEKAIDYQHVPAIVSMGVLYLNGHGVQQNYDLSLHYFIKAFKEGSDDAEFNIALMLLDGLGIEKDIPKGISILKKMADNKYPDAYLQLGYLYHEGIGVPQDYEIALVWYLKAVELGNFAAQVNIARMFMDEKSSIHDYQQSLKWSLKAAENEVTSSFGMVAYHYRFGLGVEENKAEAKKWLIKAADVGDEDAKKILEIEYSEKKQIGLNLFRKLFN